MTTKQAQTPKPQAEPPLAYPPEPCYFSTGGATADEIAAWRAAHPPVPIDDGDDGKTD